MSCVFTGVVINALDPLALARFWGSALRREARPLPDGAVELMPTDVSGVGVIVVPGAVAKVGQNRIHFDLTTASDTDQIDTISELLATGAARADIGQRDDEPHEVLADPEGNELCVIEPGNRFLAGCGRLGAVNCDGTHALGEFFSAALGWPLVWDQEEETAIQHPSRTGPKITWSGPPLMPRPPTDRIHLHLAPAAGVTTTAALAHLAALGATVLDGAGCAGAIGLADVDLNRFCLVSRR